MKAKELMIGDWVQGFFPDTYSQIGQTTWNGSVIIFTRNGVEIDLNEEDVQPVPLTAEILEKNGFERGQNISDEAPFDLDEEGNAYYQVGELGYLNPHMWGWFKDGVLELPNTCTMDIKIRYVHELQHALRLCGLNELADNFKI